MNSCIEALLVEDNCSDAQLVETVVGVADQAQPPKLYRVDRFREALSILKTTDFDVILLDLHLPDGEGVDLIRQVKKVAPEVPVVVITGSGAQDDEAAAFSEGADDYLIKTNVFSPQRIAELGYIDVGNLLVQRLQETVKKARLVASLETGNIFPSALQTQLYTSDEDYIIPGTPDNSELGISDSGIGESDTAPEAEQPVLEPIEHFVQSTLYSVGITLMSALGILKMQEGRYLQAEPLLEGALTIRRRLLGPTHPDVIVSLHDLATLYDNQGRYIEAEDLFYEALKLCEDVFGTDSPLTRKFRNRALVISRMNQTIDRDY